MRADLLAPLSQAVATFAGAIFVLIGIWYRDQLETKAAKKSARIQIVAEIRDLLDLIRLNGYFEGLHRIIESLKKGGHDYLSFSSNRSFTSVYEANLQNLGHLDATASEVVRFYMILLSSLEDKDTIADLGGRIRDMKDKGIAIDPALLQELLRRHEYFLSKLGETVRIGEKILLELA